MHEVTIKVSMNIGFGQEKYACFTVPMMLAQEQEFLQCIDVPDINAPMEARMFCSPQGQIDRVMENREHYAKAIAENITEKLLEMFSSGDTKMGYPKTSLPIHEREEL
jgi:hypothetical protein